MKLLFKKQRREKYCSDDSEEEKSDIDKEKRKKTTFVDSGSDVILNSEPKYKQIVCYEESESDIELDIDIGMNINVENNTVKPPNSGHALNSG